MKGQSLLNVVMWIGGTALTLSLGAASLIVPKFARVDASSLDHAQRISKIETSLQRLPIIEEEINETQKKIDALLWRSGINPEKITQVK